MTMFAILMNICSSCETVADDAADDAYEPGSCADVAYDDDGAASGKRKRAVGNPGKRLDNTCLVICGHNRNQHLFFVCFLKTIGASNWCDLPVYYYFHHSAIHLTKKIISCG